MPTFGEVLQERRRQAGMSQRELASRIGVDFSYISKLENDRLPPPSSDTAARIAAELACPVEDLLSAARKLPSGTEDAIAGAPAALRFLQRAADLDLSCDEWEQMLARLDDLRGGISGTEGKPGGAPIPTRNVTPWKAASGGTSTSITPH